jgi:hypothetical protein
VSNELEHHLFPVVRCQATPSDLMSFYGIAVRRGGIESPSEFCSIDTAKGTTTVLTSLWVTLIWLPGVLS